MEDLDLIQRIDSQASLKRIGIPLYSSSRRWESRSIFHQAYLNAKLRYRWKKGESSYNLAKDYYLKK